MVLLLPFMTIAQPTIMLNNNIENVGKQITLKWSDEDKPCLYDVYLDASSSPQTIIASNLKENYFAVTVDNPHQKYYYKIVVKKQGNKESETSIYNFTPWSSPCSLSFNMIDVDGGEFIMGGENFVVYPGFESSGKMHSTSETPARNIFLDDYSIAKHEITYAQFLTFLNSIKESWTVDATNGKILYKTGERYYYNQILCDKAPVEFCNITGINEAFDFMTDSKLLWDQASSTLSIKPGFEQYPANWISQEAILLFADWAGMRLPTEAEWEYAAKGGKKSNNYRYSGSNNANDVAWYLWGDVNMANPMTGNNNGIPARNNKGTNKVGLKKANELGIYDMSGNVRELCSDYFNGLQYRVSELINPLGPLSGNTHSARGGSFKGIEIYLMNTGRGWSTANFDLGLTGIRMVGNHSSNQTVMLHGIIKDEFGKIPSGVEITCNNAKTSLQPYGRYQLRVAKGEDCVIKPFHPDYDFSPSEIRVTNPEQVITNLNFKAHFKRECKISGKIILKDGLPPRKRIRGFTLGDVVSDFYTGEYSTFVPAGSELTVLIFEKDYKPIEKKIIVGTSDIENLDFVLEPWEWYSVYGTAPKRAEILGFPLKKNATYGQYSCDLPKGWSGTLSTRNISSTGYEYATSPAKYEVTNLSEYLEVNFTESGFQSYISGKIVDQNGNPVSGVDIKGAPYKVNSNEKGEFWICVTKSWEGNITPEHDDYTFSPASLALTFPSGIYMLNAQFTASPKLEHTINIAIQDENGKPLQGIELSGFDKKVQTGLNGNYFQFIDKSKSYTICPLHKNYTFSPAVLNLSNITGDITQTITAKLKPSELEFAVQEEDGSPVSNATLNFDGANYQTNASGSIILNNPSNGIFNYTVTANNYQSVSSTVVVYQGKIKVIVNLKKLPSVSFVVKDKDKNGPIANAEITLNGSTYKTDALGKVVIFPVQNGKYNFSVAAKGFQTCTGYITVDGDDIVQTVLLVEQPAFLLTVRTSISPIPNATVTLLTGSFIGKTYKTDSQGKVEIREDFVYGGKYYYEVTYSGLKKYTGSFIIYVTDVSETITMTSQKHTLIFNITDGVVPINNATITFNGTIHTTSNGTIDLGEVFEGTYSYTVSAEGYGTYSGSIQLNADTQKEIVLTKSHTVTFVITDKNGNPLPDVYIYFDPTTYNSPSGITDSNGKVSILHIEDGIHYYEVYNDGYDYITDQLTISGADITIPISLDLLKVTFKVSDTNGVPLANATVSVFGVDNFTDATGEVTVAGAIYGSCIYKVSYPNFTDVTGSETISSNTTIAVTMVRSNNTSFTVTFYDCDGTILKQEILNSGLSATAPADPSRTGYIFIGWDIDFSKVTSDLIVSAQYALITSVENTTENTVIKIYPNPIKHVLVIEIKNLSLIKNAAKGISIFNSSGLIVYHSQQINLKQEINISHYPKGIYLVSIGKETKKIIKM